MPAFQPVDSLLNAWTINARVNAYLIANTPDEAWRATYAKSDVAAALNESSQVLAAALRHALSTDGRIPGFKPDAAAFIACLFAHDAHRRGQICLLVRQPRHPISKSAGFGLWEWGTR